MYTDSLWSSLTEALPIRRPCEEKEYTQYGFMLDSVIVGILSTLGIVFNLFEAIVLINMTQSQIKLLLSAESVVSILFCLLLIPTHVCSQLYLYNGSLVTFYNSQVYFKVYFDVCMDMMLTCSVWLTVWACRHRCVEICGSGTTSLLTESYGIGISRDEIKIIMAAGITVHLPLLFDNVLQEVADPCYPPIVTIDRTFNQMGKSHSYVITYKLVFLPVLQFLVPLCILLADAYKVHNKLKATRVDVATYFRWEDDTVATELDKHAFIFLACILPNLAYTIISTADELNTELYPPIKFDLVRSLTTALIACYVSCVKMGMLLGLCSNFRAAAYRLLCRVMGCFNNIHKRLLYNIETRRISKAMRQRVTELTLKEVATITTAVRKSVVQQLQLEDRCTQTQSVIGSIFLPKSLQHPDTTFGLYAVAQGCSRTPTNDSMTHALTAPCTTAYENDLQQPTTSPGPFISVDAVSKASTASTQWIHVSEVEQVLAPAALLVRAVPTPTITTTELGTAANIALSLAPAALPVAHPVPLVSTNPSVQIIATTTRETINVAAMPPAVSSKVITGIGAAALTSTEPELVTPAPGEAAHAVDTAPDVASKDATAAALKAAFLLAQTSQHSSTSPGSLVLKSAAPYPDTVAPQVNEVMVGSASGPGLTDTKSLVPLTGVTVSALESAPAAAADTATAASVAAATAPTTSTSALSKQGMVAPRVAPDLVAPELATTGVLVPVLSASPDTGRQRTAAPTLFAAEPPEKRSQH